jgi:NADH-quinone oxidoreductase subunit J
MIANYLATGAFYVFAAVLLASAAMVVTSRNPVYAVLFLVLAFFNAAGLFLLAGAEFLAMLLVIVYVGAVAVLFLFVVMMLDVNFATLRGGFQRYAPVGILVGLVLLAELGLVFGTWTTSGLAQSLRASPMPEGITNTEALGRILYTDYVILFQAAGLVLLVAMIGAIVLTMREKKSSRHQNVAKQIARNPADTLVLVNAGLGEGINILGIRRPLPPPGKAAHGDHGHDDAHAPEPHVHGDH